jgi:hypothetical protein
MPGGTRGCHVALPVHSAGAAVALVVRLLSNIDKYNELFTLFDFHVDSAFAANVGKSTPTSA